MSQLTGLFKRGNAFYLRIVLPPGHPATPCLRAIPVGATSTPSELAATEKPFAVVCKSVPRCCAGYAGVSTAILLFTKTNSGGTDHVWFYDMKADGWSLDDKRQPLLSDDKLSLQPFKDGRSQLSEAEHEKNNLPDLLERWGQRDLGERQRDRIAQSFCVPKADIAGNGYDLSINRYKEVVHEATEHLPPRMSDFVGPSTHFLLVNDKSDY